MSGDLKQVIVVRTDLNMRKGKMAAQVAHGSMKVLLQQSAILSCTYVETEEPEPGETSPCSSRRHVGHKVVIPLTPAMCDWLRGVFTKIVVGVGSEEELLAIHKAAQDADVLTALITDNGTTEFHGVPTNTVVAVGPDTIGKVDALTGHLKLL